MRTFRCWALPLAVTALLLVPTVALATLTPAAGWRVSDFATGFASAGPAGVGPIGLAFDPSGASFYAGDIVDGSVYRLPPPGGAVGPASKLSATPLGGGPAGLAFTADGRLYLAREAAGDVVELNPLTGAVVRTVASGFAAPAALAVDPISGDLFFTAVNRPLERISNLNGATPVVSAYAPLVSPDGVVFAPDGTAYAVDHQAAAVDIVKVAATNSPTPGAVSVIAQVPTADGIAVGANPTDHAKPPFLAVNRNDGTITMIDLVTLAQSDIASGGSRGDFTTVGPDGCLYATQSDRISKITAADGTCPFGRRFEPVGPFSPPSASTVGAIQSTPTAVTVYGLVNPHGIDTTGHFQYGSTSAYGTSTGSVDAGAGKSDTYSAAVILNLPPCATVHYQLVAQSGAGTTNGGDKTLQTACPPPTVSTGQPTQVTLSSATLNGSVNPQGLPTQYHFDYGLDQAYGTQTAPQSAGAGTQAQLGSSGIANLRPCTTYHYRIEAVNQGGVTEGNDVTAQTTCPAPPASPQSECATVHSHRSRIGPGHLATLRGRGRPPRLAASRLPARPVLLSPAAGSRVRAGIVRFRWRPAARAARYTLIVDRHQMNTRCRTVVTMRLRAGGHRWLVRAVNRFGSRRSRPASFRAILCVPGDFGCQLALPTPGPRPGPMPVPVPEAGALRVALAAVAAAATVVAEKCIRSGACSPTRYRSPTEVHHIVAQHAVAARPSRQIFNYVVLPLRTANPDNLVQLSTAFHRRLHTSAYYAAVNTTLAEAYALGGSRPAAQHDVRVALRLIATALSATDPGRFPPLAA